MKSDVIYNFSGEFTCRVDFRQSPTKYHRVRLSVIGERSRPDTNTNFELEIFLIKVPPQKPIIMDQTGKRVVGEVLGPLDQGQTITLDCLVNGGKSGGHL